MLTTLIYLSAFAAPISWEAPQDTRSADQVLNAGTIVDGVNSSQYGGLPAVLNGVGLPPGLDVFDNPVGSRPLNGLTTGDADLDAFLGSFDVGSSVDTFEVGDGRLQVGETYIVQVFFTDMRSCCISRAMIFSDEVGNEVTLDARGSSPGVGSFGTHAVGIFEADADTQSITITPVNGANAHITGYQVRHVETGDLLVRTALNSNEDIELIAAGYVPGETVGFAFSDRRGTFGLPGCAGVTLDIARPTLVGTAAADASGVARLTFRPPTAASGDRLHLQSGSVSSCAVGGRLDVDVD